jgi:cyanate lyase
VPPRGASVSAIRRGDQGRDRRHDRPASAKFAGPRGAIRRSIGCVVAAPITCIRKEKTMKRADLTEKLLDIKREKGWSWKHICGAIGGFSEILITAALLGQMKLTKQQAAKAAELFGLDAAEEALLNEIPYRGSFAAPPTDPLIYRFYELVMVYGTAWKELIQEEFGDGIMSAIDFDMQMERLPDPKGDRVKITMSGKFLPYKYYGNEGNIPEYGFKED